jgi:hypothetical protein
VRPPLLQTAHITGHLVRVSGAWLSVERNHRPSVRRLVVLHCHTKAEGLDWLPEDGVVLTRADLERIFIDLRALISGTDQLDPNRSFAVDIAVAITHAIERESGGQ